MWDRCSLIALSRPNWGEADIHFLLPRLGWYYLHKCQPRLLVPSVKRIKCLCMIRVDQILKVVTLLIFTSLHESALNRGNLRSPFQLKNSERVNLRYQSEEESTDILLYSIQVVKLTFYPVYLKSGGRWGSLFCWSVELNEKGRFSDSCSGNNILVQSYVLVLMLILCLCLAVWEISRGLTFKKVYNFTGKPLSLPQK